MKFTTEAQVRSILKGVVQCDLVYPTALVRLQDDTDGNRDAEHQLVVSQGPDGDMYVGVGYVNLLRFRTHAGGGRSLAVHNALRMLAQAIKLDNDRDPLAQAVLTLGPYSTLYDQIKSPSSAT